jgi:hypothetical protein
VRHPQHLAIGALKTALAASLDFLLINQGWRREASWRFYPSPLQAAQQPGQIRFHHSTACQQRDGVLIAPLELRCSAIWQFQPLNALDQSKQRLREPDSAAVSASVDSKIVGTRLIGSTSKCGSPRCSRVTKLAVSAVRDSIV